MNINLEPGKTIFVSVHCNNQTTTFQVDFAGIINFGGIPCLIGEKPGIADLETLIFPMHQIINVSYKTSILKINK